MKTTREEVQKKIQDYLVKVTFSLCMQSTGK